MRILHLLAATDDSGGILTVLRNLQHATAPAGVTHQVWVNARYRELRKPALDYRYSRYVVQDSPNHAGMALRSLAGLIEVRRLLRREPPDVIHAHTRGAFLIAVGLASTGSRGVVFTNHGYARRTGLYRWGARRRGITTTLLTPNMARHYGLEPSTDKLHIVSECCADDYFAQPLPAAKPASPQAPIRLVGLGNVVEWKNWHLLLEALMQLPPAEQRRFEFHHWGSVPDDSACRAYEQRLGALLKNPRLAAACHFHGLSLDVVGVLRTADWFVLPSTNEPCSVALIEALALGVPALVSASGGNVDIVRDNHTGLRFAPDDPGSLAMCLGRLARGEVQPSPSPEIRESVRFRSATAVAGEYLGIYRTVASRRG